MRSRILTAAVAFFLASAGTFVLEAEPGDPELEKGVRLAQEGEFEQALATLRAALPRLKDGPPGDLARAHVYLGIADLGLGDAVAARASFLDALRLDPALKLSAEEYPPRVVRAFEEARSALPPVTTTPPAAVAPPPPASAPQATPVAARPTPSAPAPPAKVATQEKKPPEKKKSSLPLVLIGAGVAAAGGVALATGGGGGSSTASTSSPPATTPVAPGGEVRLVSTFPPTGGEVRLPADPRAGTSVPEVVFDVVYGADVATAGFEINLWRGPDLCHSTGVAYAERLDGPGPQYKAGTTARYRVGFWTTRQPGCGNAYATDRFEFAWGSIAAPLFVQNLSVGWSFSR
jgi:hypothetical protein